MERCFRWDVHTKRDKYKLNDVFIYFLFIYIYIWIIFEQGDSTRIGGVGRVAAQLIRTYYIFSANLRRLFSFFFFSNLTT